MDTERMNGSAHEVCDLLKALSHPHRLMVVCQLLEGERSVGELASLLDLRDSTTSQHLAFLRKDRIVRARREGQTLWYSIRNDNVRQILELLYRMFCQGKHEV